MGELKPTIAAGLGIARPSPIGAQHVTSGFVCGHPSLDDWLKNIALRAQGRRTARTYVVCEGDVVVGYYCLAAGSVSRDDVPKGMRSDVPRQIPIAVIGRLAVDQAYQKRGIGPGMLQDAFRRVIRMSEAVGCAAVVVHAIDGVACGFYNHYGFVEFPSGTKTLFLPVETIIASLG